MVRAIALGADACYQARGMKMALGCIQALMCNTNRCPTGITTQDPKLTRGLVVEDKKVRVANYHSTTLKNFAELLSATGVTETKNLKRSHIYRRISLNSMITYEELFPTIKIGSMLINKNIPEKYRLDFEFADKTCWGLHP